MDEINQVKYRDVIVTLFHELSPEEREIIKIINKKWRRPSLYITSSSENLILKLRSIDFEYFKKKIIEESLKHSLSIEIKDNLTDNPFLRLIHEVEIIGSYGIKSGKRIYVGYADERKVKSRVEKEKSRGSFYYTNENLFNVENTEFPPKCENKIICGDSEEVLKKLPENCIDLIVTSPPYNFGLDYADSKDEHYWVFYFEKLFNVFSECIRILKFGGRIAVNVQPLFSDYIPSHHIISNFFMEKKMIWKGEILWEKNNYNCKYTAWGSWKSPSNPYLKYTWEFVEIFCKGTLKKAGDKTLADISPDEFKQWVVAKWSIGPERRMKEFSHPAMFPEELVTRVMKLFSFKGDIILDPFNGVGTSCVVAKQLGRRYLGIDISQEYCNKSIERLNETDRQESLQSYE